MDTRVENTTVTATGDKKPVRLYRLHTAIEHGSTSTSSINFYENTASFERALLDALIDTTVNARRPPIDNEPAYRDWSACWTWARTIITGRHKRGDDRWRVKRIISVRELIDGEWVELYPELVPPRIMWTSP